MVFLVPVAIAGLLTGSLEFIALVGILGAFASLYTRADIGIKKSVSAERSGLQTTALMLDRQGGRGVLPGRVEEVKNVAGLSDVNEADFAIENESSNEEFLDNSPRPGINGKQRH